MSYELHILQAILGNQYYQTTLLQHILSKVGGMNTELASLGSSLTNHTEKLQAAIAANTEPPVFPSLVSGVSNMANQTLDNLAQQVTSTNGVIDSAVTLINGIASRVQTAVDAAIAGGATAAELQPVQAEVDSLKAKSDALAAAIAANP